MVQKWRENTDDTHLEPDCCCCSATVVVGLTLHCATQVHHFINPMRFQLRISSMAHTSFPEPPLVSGREVSWEVFCPLPSLTYDLLGSKHQRLLVRSNIISSHCHSSHLVNTWRMKSKAIDFLPSSAHIHLELLSFSLVRFCTEMQGCSLTQRDYRMVNHGLFRMSVAIACKTRPSSWKSFCLHVTSLLRLVNRRKRKRSFELLLISNWW